MKKNETSYLKKPINVSKDFKKTKQNNNGNKANISDRKPAWSL